ncbi:MAG TPA: hypothetical protein PKA55_02985 [Rhodoblastus sp.]|nr:hypothetical protein [Rhodoblastus sp.]
MTEPERIRLGAIQAPYGRELRLEELRFETGMRILRVTIREGHRFTTLDLDPERAREVAAALGAWANASAG